MNELVEVLTAARANIAMGFCQGPFARDQQGDACHPASGTAVQFCGGGALLAACIMHSSNRFKGWNVFDGVRGADYELWSRAQLWCNSKIADGGLHSKGLIAYSEMPGRTQAQMLVLYDQLIGAARVANL